MFLVLPLDKHLSGVEQIDDGSALAIYAPTIVVAVSFAARTDTGISQFGNDLILVHVCPTLIGCTNLFLRGRIVNIQKDLGRGAHLGVLAT